jgi:hypothetical protein
VAVNLADIERLRAEGLAADEAERSGQRRADARALRAVRVLDAWAEAVDDRSVDLSCGWLVAFKDKPHLQPPGQIRVRLLRGGDPVLSGIFYGPTPDAARIAAADALAQEDPGLLEGL